MAGFKTGKRIHGFVNLGVVPSVLTSAKTILPAVTSNGITIPEETLDVTKQVTRFDLAAALEAGGGCRLKERCLLLISVAYQQSFTSFTNSNYYENSDTKYYGITLSLGLKYALAKE
jgi:hypothetical protein